MLDETRNAAFWPTLHFSVVSLHGYVGKIWKLIAWIFHFGRSSSFDRNEMQRLRSHFDAHRQTHWLCVSHVAQWKSEIETERDWERNNGRNLESNRLTKEKKIPADARTSHTNTISVEPCRTMHTCANVKRERNECHTHTQWRKHSRRAATFSRTQTRTHEQSMHRRGQDARCVATKRVTSHYYYSTQHERTKWGISRPSDVRRACHLSLSNWCRWFAALFFPSVRCVAVPRSTLSTGTRNTISNRTNDNISKTNKSSMDFSVPIKRNMSIFNRNEEQNEKRASTSADRPIEQIHKEMAKNWKRIEKKKTGFNPYANLRLIQYLFILLLLQSSVQPDHRQIRAHTTTHRHLHTRRDTRRSVIKITFSILFACQSTHRPPSRLVYTHYTRTQMHISPFLISVCVYILLGAAAATADAIVVVDDDDDIIELLPAVLNLMYITTIRPVRLLLLRNQHTC